MTKKEILWKPRPYREGDEEQLMKLTKLALERDIAIESWRWLFKDNPAGKGFFSLADHDGNLVGQYVVIPIRLLVGGKEITGAQSMDTMTHPDYRRQGMFTTLAGEVYRNLKESGIHAAYGFPNDASHPGFVNKLGWITLIDLPFHARPLKLSSLLADRIGNKFAASTAGVPAQAAFNLLFPSSRKENHGFSTRITDRFDGEFDRLWDSVKERFSCAVCRNSDYLNWRYINKPGADYKVLAIDGKEGRLAGYAVLKTVRKEGAGQGHILDLLTADLDLSTAEILIREAITMFRDEGMDVVVCLMLKHIPYYKLLKKNGFIFKPKALPYIVRRNTEKFSEDLLFNPENWYITFGDSDFV